MDETIGNYLFAQGKLYTSLGLGLPPHYEIVIKNRVYFLKPDCYRKRPAAED